MEIESPPFTDTSYTYVYSRYNCSVAVFQFHLVLAYTVVIFGILSLLSRVVPFLVPYHVWFGRGFMIVMYWLFGTALLIHNTGLPPAILIFFSFLLVCISVGWTVIRVHAERMQRESEERVGENLMVEQRSVNSVLLKTSLSEMIAEEKGKIAQAKTWKERFFSLKALHGFCMAFAWYQMLGRSFTVNPTQEFECWTYPSYKIPPDNTTIYVPVEDPSEDKSTAGFVAMVSIPGILTFLVVGSLFSYFGAKKAQQARQESNGETEKMMFN